MLEMQFKKKKIKINKQTNKKRLKGNVLVAVNQIFTQFKSNHQFQDRSFILICQKSFVDREAKEM